MIDEEQGPTFAYNIDTPAECGLCWMPVLSSLFVVSTGRPNDTFSIQLYICDDCLLKLFNAVPLLSWAMRETIIGDEFGADLAAGG